VESRFRRQEKNKAIAFSFNVIKTVSTLKQIGIKGKQGRILFSNLVAKTLQRGALHNTPEKEKPFLKKKILVSLIS
jgi:hypothetical protein